MKTKTILFAAIILVSLSSWMLPQSVPRTMKSSGQHSISKTAGFSFFRTHHHGRYGIAATWAANANQGITTFVLQRTYEYPDEYAIWEDIYEVSANNGGNFGFLDANVFPGIINYRVVAMNGASTAFMSSINSVQIRQR